MALKPDRVTIRDDVSFHFDAVAERGGVAVYKTGVSGVGLDNTLNVAEYAANGSGKIPIGILTNDVVQVDTTRYHLNYHKDEVDVGQKVCIMVQGWVVTNLIVGTPTAGQAALLGNSGYFAVAGGAAANPTVGRFETIKDEAGYARVAVNNP